MPCGPASISQRLEGSWHLPTQDQAFQEVDCLYLTTEETSSFHTSELLFHWQRVTSEIWNFKQTRSEKLESRCAIFRGRQWN